MKRFRNPAWFAPCGIKAIAPIDYERLERAKGHGSPEHFQTSGNRWNVSPTGLFDSQRFDQIQQMGLVQTEQPCRRGPIAVGLRERPENDGSFGHL